MGILKIECTLLAASMIFLYVFNEQYLDKVWGDEDTGVSVEGKQNEESEEETKEAVVVEKPTENVDINTQIPEYNVDSEPATEVLDQPLYYIKLNRVLNTVTVYTYNNAGEYVVPIKAMRCSTGGEHTPVGVFGISDKYKFVYLSYGAYGQYCTRITGLILFHSSTYDAVKKDSLSAQDYNLLGEAVSHGCIRLTLADAKWIYDNCEDGTQVEIYDDETTPGPLGKPETIKVPEGTLWDPTDPDPANPWHEKTPTITGVENKTLYEHDDYDILKGVKAYDTCGNDITHLIQVEGEVDIDVPGLYTVTYSVTDYVGKKAEVTVEIYVV